MNAPSDVPVFEMPGQLVTGSTFGAMFGKGRSVGVARLDPSALTFITKKGETILHQDLRGIQDIEFKRMTGAIIITGDTTFKLYPPMESTGSDISDVSSAVLGVASSSVFHDAIRDLTAHAKGETGAS